MSNKLFITNISWAVTEPELNDLFSTVGTVEAIKLPVNSQTGKNKGYAFVVMTTDEEGQQAIERLNGYNLSGRELTVTVQDESRRQASEPVKTNKLFIRNIAPSVDGNALHTLISQAGQVNSLQVPLDRETGAHRGFAFVEMATDDEAEQVITRFNEHMLADMPLQIVYQDPRRSRPTRPGGGMQQPRFNAEAQSFPAYSQ
ncbi:MAG: hypothetical protein VKJ06_08450 [Vampirovibrionales bacterium]|nr:hypothetical protein [Vampirovibrionales bacterium]